MSNNYDSFDAEDDENFFADEQTSDDFANFDAKRHASRRRRPEVDDAAKDFNRQIGRSGEELPQGDPNNDFANFDPSRYLAQRRTSTSPIVGTTGEKVDARFSRKGRTYDTIRAEDEVRRDTNPLRLLWQDAGPLLRYGLLAVGCAAISILVAGCGAVCLIVLTLARRG
jgi:hypothetical protein